MCTTITSLYSSYLYQADLPEESCHDTCNAASECLAIGTLSSSGSACLLYASTSPSNLSGFEAIAFDSTEPSLYVHMPADNGLWPNSSAMCLTKQFLKSSAFSQSSDALNIRDFRFSASSTYLYAHTGASSSSPRTDVLPTWQGTYTGVYNMGHCSVGQGCEILITEMSSTGDVAFIFTNHTGDLFLYDENTNVKARATDLSNGKPHLMVFSPAGRYLLVLYGVGPTVSSWPANIQGLVLDSANGLATVCRLFFFNTVTAFTYQTQGAGASWWLRELFWFTADDGFLLAPANGSSWTSATALQQVQINRYPMTGGNIVGTSFGCTVDSARFPAMGKSNVIMCSVATCSDALGCFKLYDVSNLAANPTAWAETLQSMSPTTHSCSPMAGSGSFSSDGLRFSFPCGNFVLFGVYGSSHSWVINFYEFPGNVSSVVTATEASFLFVSYCAAYGGECYEESTFSMLSTSTSGSASLLWSLTTMSMQQAVFLSAGTIIVLRFTQGFALMNSTTGDWVGETSWASYYMTLSPDRESFATLRGTTEGSEIRWVDLRTNRTSAGYCSGMSSQDVTYDSCSLKRSLPHHYYSASASRETCLDTCLDNSLCMAADYSPYLGCRLFGTAVRGFSLVSPQTDSPIISGDKNVQLTCTPKGTDTPTLTSTPTATVVPTGTPTLTPTGRRYPVCSDTVEVVQSGKSSISISTTKSCEVAVALRSSMQETFALSAYWALHIDASNAAQVTVGFSNLTKTITSGEFTSLEELGPSVFSVTVFTSSLAARRTVSQPAVVFQEATQASGEVVALVIGLGFLVAVLATAGVLYARWRKWQMASLGTMDGTISIRVVAEPAAHSSKGLVHTSRYWWWVVYGLMWLSACCLVIAIILLPLTYALYNKAGPMPGSIKVGWLFFILGLAALVVALMVLAYCRRQICPACEKVVWPGQGWHILLEAAKGATPKRAYPGRFHERCARCFSCQKHIRWHLWVGSTPTRLAHDECWRQSCQRWMAITEVQLAHELEDFSDVVVANVAAVALMEGKLSHLQTLAEMRPLLWKKRLAEHHGWPLVTLALSERNGTALRILLAYDAEELDLVANHMLDLAKPSAYFVAAGCTTDVFLLHPFVMCCGEPVGVGRYTGWYLYRMAGGAAHMEGWHVGPILGSKDQLFLCDTLPGSFRTKPPAPFLDDLLLLHEAQVQVLDPPPSRDTSHLGLLVEEVQSPGLPERVCHQMRAPFLVGNDVAMMPVYSMTSILEQALRTGDQAIITFIVAEYKRRLGWCTVWQWQDSHGLWQDYPDEVQTTLQDVQSVAKDDVVEVSVPLDGRHHLYTVSLHALHQVPVNGAEGAAQKVRSVVPTPIFWCDSKVHESSDDVRVVLGQTLASHDQRTTHQRCRKGTFPDGQWPMVVLDPARLLDACNHSPSLLRFMVDEGLLEPSQWLLHATETDLLQQRLGPTVVHEEWHRMMAGVLRGGGLPAKVRCPLPLPQCALIPDVCKYARTHREKGLRRGCNLHTDGLSEPQLLRHRSNMELDLESSFYPADYCPAQSMMRFVYSLPGNHFGYCYETDAMLNVISNFVLKTAELQVQQRIADKKAAVLSTSHFLSLYVYTYELAGTDQIYEVVNRCMRTHQQVELLFWRPFLYHLDQAMFALPSVQARLFRGINMTFDNGAYQKGAIIRWPAYSSSSLKRAVAEEFARGSTKGTLFFLTSQTAVDISHYSRFGGEGEVLFFSNSAFEVTSTLFSDSAIGSFYSGCDNVEMRELPRHIQRPAPTPLPPAIPLSQQPQQKPQPMFATIPKLDNGHIVSTNAGILFVKGTEVQFSPLHSIEERNSDFLR
eukprot:GGOE01024141.1.p1 GENE.GGOE01024141.1~~GGOE01024141.1.p1  ORF type:complete len:1855 (-),score=543.09 GGOE01024141.1:804-6260(-)